MPLKSISVIAEFLISFCYHRHYIIYRFYSSGIFSPHFLLNIDSPPKEFFSEMKFTEKKYVLDVHRSNEIGCIQRTWNESGICSSQANGPNETLFVRIYTNKGYLICFFIPFASSLRKCMESIAVSG